MLQNKYILRIVITDYILNIYKCLFVTIQFKIKYTMTITSRDSQLEQKCKNAKQNLQK